MQTTPIDRSQVSLSVLAFPLFFENFFRIALSSVDVFMLSSYSDMAVAAVGLIGQFAFLLIILYGVVAGGSGILISQFLGAERSKEANQAALAAYTMGMVFAVVISTGIASSAGTILSFYTLEPQVFAYAQQYLIIFASGSVFLALNTIQGTIFRSFGYAREAMTANILATIVNVIGNAFSLYGFFGFPVLGVPGVAISTVLSQAFASVYVGLRMRKHEDIKIPWGELKSLPSEYYQRMLRIGIPSAAEHLSFNLGQMVITGVIALLGTAALTANVYTQTIARFSFIPALSIGYAVQIKTGYLVGAKKFDLAMRKVFQYDALGYAITVTIVVLLYVFRETLSGLFTSNSEILAITTSLMFVMMFRESGRVSNMIVIPGLRGSGDVMFPVIIGVLVQWIVAVGGSFYVHFVLQGGIVGIWWVLAADEIIRSMIMLFRWKSGAWKTKRLVY
jgi:putative MATE family efflux protein